MKEIQAISKLAHKNVVGYKGCWVEADEPEVDRLKRIGLKINKRQQRRVGQLCEEIDENSEDDPEFVLNVEL